MNQTQQLTLPQGLPGFPEFTAAQLRPLDNEELPGVYAELASDAGDVRFLLARPHPFFPEYAFDVDDATTAVLGQDPAAIDVWVLLTHTADGFTANLRGPVLVNRDSGCALQAVLTDAHPLRAALV